MRTYALLLPMAGLLIQPVVSSAQRTGDIVPGAAVGVSFIVGVPTEEFSDFIDAGYGAEVTGRARLEPTGLVSLRGDLGFLIYGFGSRNVRCGTCGEATRLYTSNGIFFGGIGPELSIPLDWGRPYLNAFAGFGYFSTSSTTGSYWWEEEPATTETMGDGAFSFGFGGGIEFNLRRGDAPIFLSVGARYHQHGVMRYLRQGDIRDNPDGSVTLFPVASEANLVSFRIGVTAGISGHPSGNEVRD